MLPDRNWPPFCDDVIYHHSDILYYVFCNSFTLLIFLRVFCIRDQCIMCVCVCVCVCACACMHVKGDCGSLKCNPPLENPANGLVYKL